MFLNVKREYVVCVCVCACVIVCIHMCTHVHMYIHPCVQIDKSQWEGNQIESNLIRSMTI